MSRLPTRNSNHPDDRDERRDRRPGRLSRRDFARGGAVVAAGTIASAAMPSAEPASATSRPSAAAAAVASGSPSATNTTLDGLTGWVVPKDWGSSWRAKLAAAKNGTATAVCALVGDSVGYGYWASNLVSTSFVEILRARLAALVGNGGSGFQSQTHSPSVMYNPRAGVPDYYKTVPGNVWQQSSGWTPQVPPYIYGQGGGALMATVNGATIFNYVYGTRLGVWYYDGGADFSVEINGQTVGTVRVGTSYLPAHTTFAVPGGRFDVHSWRITGNVDASSGKGTTIVGVEGLAASGARVDNFSFPGLISRAYANQDDARSGTYAGGWRNPADLVIYELGGDDISGQDPDYPNGTPADVWAQNVQSYLDGVMNTTYGGDATGQTDLVLMFPVGNSAGDLNRLYLEYKTRAIGIAQSFGAALFDANAIFHGSWNAWYKQGFAGNRDDPTTSGSDFNHPGDAGSTFLADQLSRLIVSLT